MAGLLSPYVTSWDDDTAAFLHDTDRFTVPSFDLLIHDNYNIHSPWTDDGELDLTQVHTNLLVIAEEEREPYLEALGIEPATIGDFL